MVCRYFRVCLSQELIIEQSDLGQSLAPLSLNDTRPTTCVNYSQLEARRDTAPRRLEPLEFRNMIRLLFARFDESQGSQLGQGAIEQDKRFPLIRLFFAHQRDKCRP